MCSYCVHTFWSMLQKVLRAGFLQMFQLRSIIDQEPSIWTEVYGEPLSTTVVWGKLPQIAVTVRNQPFFQKTQTVKLITPLNADSWDHKNFIAGGLSRNCLQSDFSVSQVRNDVTDHASPQKECSLSKLLRPPAILLWLVYSMEAYSDFHGNLWQLTSHHRTAVHRKLQSKWKVLGQL